VRFPAASLGRLGSDDPVRALGRAPQLRLRGCNVPHCREEAVEIERYGVDPASHEEGREIGVVARALTADSGPDSGGVGLAHRLAIIVSSIPKADHAMRIIS